MGGLIVGTLVALLLLGAAIVLSPVGSPPGGGRSPDSTIEPTSTPDRSSLASQVPAASPAFAEPSVGIDLGQLAPDFTLGSLDGDTVHLSDFLGKPVWIDFWAPWCPPCRDEMPRIEGAYLAHRADDLVVLGIAVRDSESSVRDFIGQVGVSYPILLDEAGTVADRYRALALPVKYWIDRDGIIRDWAIGELPPDLLERELTQILPRVSPSP